MDDVSRRRVDVHVDRIVLDGVAAPDAAAFRAALAREIAALASGPEGAAGVSEAAVRGCVQRALAPQGGGGSMP